MRRHALTAALALCALGLVFTPGALAHQGNPNFRSIITAVTPSVKGVSLQVLSLDDRLELTNTSGRPVIVYGYREEPYVQILGDGTVQVNKRSPAGYLNQERYATSRAPASADPRATPQWQTVDKTGRYEWHDHRIHFMATGIPPQVKDKRKRTKIFNWTVPIAVGGQKGAVAGQLFWQPRDTSGPPTGAIIGFVVLLLLGAATVVVVRRRRGENQEERGAGDGGDAESPSTSGRGEAW
ncbi:MAG: hypothetical protein JWM31_2386 [Solirubrobacterales bacterium]|nr:hypothetical protein [Solirubrobacterales bacterium]